jgi:hypothetical protein
MDSLRYTLVAEGNSDRVLMPILDWLLRENGIQSAIQPEFADIYEAFVAEKITLAVKIRESVRLYPCDLLFVHRDADTESRSKRVEEIETAVVNAELTSSIPYVCVIPVKMQEAWLLFDEEAIRYAAGNPNGRQPLELPLLNQLETVADPKLVLADLLKAASGLSGRRLKRFNISQSAKLITYFADDFSPLQQLPAFQALENEIKQFVAVWMTENSG